MSIANKRTRVSFHFGKLNAQDSTSAGSKNIISTPCCPYINYSFECKQNLRVTPAKAAGLTKRFMSLEDIANLVPDEAPKKEVYIKKG